MSLTNKGSVKSDALERLIASDASEGLIASDALEGLIASDASEGLIASDALERLIASDALERLIASDALERLIASDASEGLIASDASEGLIASEVSEGLLASEGSKRWEARDMPVRLIASDMDGTLLGLDNLISAGNMEALRLAHEAGIALCIASGRAPYEIERITGMTDLPLHFLALNGALVRVVGQEDSTFPLKTSDLALCIDAAEEAGIDWLIYCADKLCSSRLLPRAWSVPENVVGRKQALEFGERALKFIGFCPDNAAALAKARRPIEMAGMAVSSSGTENFEVNAPGIDKGSALCALAGRLQIPKEQVMALGDFENDLTMLTWAGVSVAMENAIPCVQKIAKYKTGHHTKDGVAQAIRGLALGGRSL